MRVKLRYLKGSKEASAGLGIDGRMWDILEPVFPEYSHGIGRVPTFSRDSLIDFLKRKGLVKNEIH
jgi:hypothetical protein